MLNAPAAPRNVNDLKMLLEAYGSILSPENRAFISELIARLEAGGDMPGLVELAERMRKSAPPR